MYIKAQSRLRKKILPWVSQNCEVKVKVMTEITNVLAGSVQYTR